MSEETNCGILVRGGVAQAVSQSVREKLSGNCQAQSAEDHHQTICLASAGLSVRNVKTEPDIQLS